MAQSTADELESVLNKELQSVVEWVTANKLVLNVSKTKSIVFGTKNLLMNESNLSLYVKDVIVEQVQETKLLGIIVDSKLSWSKHIDKVVSKMGRGQSFLPSNVMGNVIKTLVLSHLDYCSEVWSSAAVSHIKKLLKIRQHVVYFGVHTEPV